MRAKLVIIVSILVFVFITASNLYAISLAELDRTKWYDCVDKKDCLQLSNKFKWQYKKRGYQKIDGQALALSLVLSEYLSGDPFDLGVTDIINNITSRFHGDPVSNLIKAFHLITLNKGTIEKVFPSEAGISELACHREEAPGRRGDPPSATISCSLIKYLLNNGDWDYEKKAFIPFLALQQAKEMVSLDKCEVAIEKLKLLIRKYKLNAEVVLTWSEAKMMCKDYSSDVLKKLQKVYKKNHQDWVVIARMIQFMNHVGDREGVERLISEVDSKKIKDKNGSELFHQWAQFEIKNGEIEKAEWLLQRAIKLNPKNTQIYRSLGEFYLLNKKDLPKAVTYLENYILLAVDRQDAEKMRALVENLKISMDSMGF